MLLSTPTISEAQKALSAAAVAVREEEVTGEGRLKEKSKACKMQKQMQAEPKKGLPG